jgi:hypothetical protein
MHGAVVVVAVATTAILVAQAVVADSRKKHSP